MIRQVFCDESRPNCDRFMVLGGIIVPRVSLESMVEEIQTLRDAEGLHAEIKWSKVSKRWLPKYKAFVDYFFELNQKEKLHFHSMIVERRKVNHREYSEGDRELGFYKLYYQLLLHCFGRDYCPKPEDRFIVYLDARQTSYPVPELRRILNNGVAKNFNNHRRPFLSVEPQDSKAHDFLQVTDLLIGAIGYQRNGCQKKAGASPAKTELAEYIAAKAGMRNLGHSTPLKVKRFTVWNFRFREKENVALGRAIVSTLDMILSDRSGRVS